MPKTNFLQIRLTPGDRLRVARAAAAEYLDVSTWARQAILRSLDTAEAGHAQSSTDSQEGAPRETEPRRPVLRVAEESRRRKPRHR